MREGVKAAFRADGIETVVGGAACSSRTFRIVSAPLATCSRGYQCNSSATLRPAPKHRAMRLLPIRDAWLPCQA